MSAYGMLDRGFPGLKQGVGYSKVTSKVAGEEIPFGSPEAVKEQTALIEVASKADVAIEAGMSAQAIKTAIVLKVFPKADVEALKQDAYLQARYDGVVELLAEKQEADKQAQVTEVGGQAVKQDSASDRIKNACLNAWKAK